MTAEARQQRFTPEIGVSPPHVAYSTGHAFGKYSPVVCLAEHQTDRSTNELAALEDYVELKDPLLINAAIQFFLPVNSVAALLLYVYVDPAFSTNHSYSSPLAADMVLFMLETAPVPSLGEYFPHLARTSDFQSYTRSAKPSPRMYSRGSVPNISLPEDVKFVALAYPAEVPMLSQTLVASAVLVALNRRTRYIRRMYRLSSFMPQGFSQLTESPRALATALVLRYRPKILAGRVLQHFFRQIICDQLSRFTPIH